MGSPRRLFTGIATLAMVATLVRTASAQLCFSDGDCNDFQPCTFDHCFFNFPGFPSGVCLYEPATGPACDDGDACTISDTCQSGSCTGTDVCTCGGCGCGDGSCDDGNPCTVDVCENFIDCFGCCHATIPNDGLGCNDGNACTRTDTCQNGTCQGGIPVQCPPPDQCHTAGTCNPATGACSNPAKADGTPCNDGSQCTRSDSCRAGACVGAEPVVCPVADQCNGAGACDPATGTCTAPKKPDGAPCDDGNRCTRTDTCMAGACVGADPVVCAPADQCHEAGTCTAATGICTHPLKNSPECPPCAADAECDDGNACTVDACVAGTCARTPGNAGVTCRPAVDLCDVAEVCPGTSANCPADQFKQATTVCRAAVDLCDAAETCTGSSAACPADARKNVGDVCDDGDPGTGISSCNDAQVCTGVSTMVTLQPETPVPPTQSPKRVRIPMTFEMPDTGGTNKATATAQGLVDCLDVPPALRPPQCGQLRAVAAGVGAGIQSVFLRVTPRIKLSLGRTQARSVGVGLPLTKLGRKLFALLGSSEGGLTVHVRCRLRDREGRRIDVTAPTALKRL